MGFSHSKFSCPLSPASSPLTAHDLAPVDPGKNSKCWQVWQANLKKTLSSGQIFGSEGLAINISVYIDDVETEFLPINCNWIASNLLPKLDQGNNKFVEPFLPNISIGIMHLAAGIWKDGKDMRVDKSIKIDIETLSKNKVSKSLRYLN